MTEVATPAPTRRSAADAFARRLLLVPEAPAAVSERKTQRIFQTGILLSALRCLLTYVVLPLLGPVLGLAGGVGPALGLPLAILALVFDVIGMRRFFVADHRNRWSAAFVYLGVMALVVALMAIDILDLLG